jgi:hypothetical protein
MSHDMRVRNVVLVHGGFVDGSGWQAVYDRLTDDGYHVALVQNPMHSLERYVAATRQVIESFLEPGSPGAAGFDLPRSRAGHVRPRLGASAPFATSSGATSLGGSRSQTPRSRS